MNNAIEIENLTRFYGKRMGVQTLTFNVRAGTVFGFLGPNGAGKSTTIKILMGFMRSHSGGARIFGLDCWRQSADIKKIVGYLPDDLRWYDWMTPRLALKIVSQVRHQDLVQSGTNLADRFNLDINLKIGRMSRGTRQKVGLVLAFAHQPRLLILDEPTTALDPLVQELLFDYLREQADNGVTVFFSSHTLSEVERLCDHVAILRQGKLVAENSMMDLRQQAGRRVLIQWEPSSHLPEQFPEDLMVIQCDNHECRAIWQKNTRDLVQWCARQPIADLVIEPPDLSEIFQNYYRETLS